MLSFVGKRKRAGATARNYNTAVKRSYSCCLEKTKKTLCFNRSALKCLKLYSAFFHITQTILVDCT